MEIIIDLPTYDGTTLSVLKYSNNKLDVTKTIIMALIHDVVEIDAGDTYAYDEEGAKTQKEREEIVQNLIDAGCDEARLCLCNGCILARRSGQAL